VKRDLIVTTPGRESTVSVEGPLADGRFKVVIDGTEQLVDARAVRPGTWSLVIAGRQYLVDLDHRRGGIAASVGAGEVVLQVEDSGPGIPAPEREKVFRPFYRALGTGADGSGLGLAIVREIADRHGAEVTLADAGARTRSGGGIGAMFTVRFVASARPSSGSEPVPASVQPETRSRAETTLAT